MRKYIGKCAFIFAAGLMLAACGDEAEVNKMSEMTQGDTLTVLENINSASESETQVEGDEEVAVIDTSGLGTLMVSGDYTVASAGVYVKQGEVNLGNTFPASVISCVVTNKGVKNLKMNYHNASGGDDIAIVSPGETKIIECVTYELCLEDSVNYHAEWPLRILFYDEDEKYIELLRFDVEFDDNYYVTSLTLVEDINDFETTGAFIGQNSFENEENTDDMDELHRDLNIVLADTNSAKLVLVSSVSTISEDIMFISGKEGYRHEMTLEITKKPAKHWR